MILRCFVARLRFLLNKFYDQTPTMAKAAMVFILPNMAAAAAHRFFACRFRASLRSVLPAACAPC
jgi:hypothetical protein